MSNKKYKVIPITKNGKDYFQLVALRNFTNRGISIKENSYGGLIGRDVYLSHTGTCWVDKGCEVYGKTNILNDALITGNVSITGNCVIKDFTLIQKRASINGDCIFSDHTLIDDFVIITGNVITKKETIIKGNTFLSGNFIINDSILKDKTFLSGDFIIIDSWYVGDTMMRGENKVSRGDVYGEEK